MLASLILLPGLALAGGTAVLLVRGVKRAPEGYEDEQGFHPGPMPPDPGRNEGRAMVAVGASADRGRAKSVRITTHAPREVGQPLKVC
ncbi:MAG TPA: hypothetical protein VLW52_12275 [Opitutaceae bacterium]|nr:hypothetical protein [Opitutaceae bacterium]